jgi:hypothetical protein
VGLLPPKLPFKIRFGILLSNILTTCVAHYNILPCMYITSLEPYSLHTYSVHGILQSPLIYTLSAKWLYIIFCIGRIFYLYIYIVCPGVMCQTSGGCSLC